MNENRYISQIYLTSNHVSIESWQKFIFLVSKYFGMLSSWKIIVRIHLNEVRYYLETPNELPTTIGELSTFLLKKDKLSPRPIAKTTMFTFNKLGCSLVDTYDRNEVRHDRTLKEIVINIVPINENRYLSSTHFYLVNKHNQLIKKRVYFNALPKFLSVDFSSHNRFFYKKAPKYLNLQKSLHLLKSDQSNSILKIDTFPYLSGDFYLNQANYNFDKHSIVIGASGTGKSKLTSLLVNNIAGNTDYRRKYKIVIIDPHAALENDIGGLENTVVLNFKSLEDSVDLFMNSTDDLIASSELIMTLFKSLLADQYNSKLERMLRYAVHLLLAKQEFTFVNLRKLLLDTEHRNALVKELEAELPESVVDFFLTDFNDLKTKSYGEAIAPIISFVDEMQLLPVFNSNAKIQDISDVIKNNFITIFSLDRATLGEKVTKTIAGLVMQQVFQLIQAAEVDEHIIFVIDEVSSIENPILSRFLSEARKYGLSLLLAQQYFNQISDGLKNAIFANMVNYYVFRVSRLDATLLESNLMMNLAVDNSGDARVKILAGLNDRECIVRVNSNGLLVPAFKAKTLDFVSIPTKKKIKVVPSTIDIPNTTININEPKQKFSIGNVVPIGEIMKSQSTSGEDIGGKNE